MCVQPGEESGVGSMGWGHRLSSSCSQSCCPIIIRTMVTRASGQWCRKQQQCQWGWTSGQSGPALGWPCLQSLLGKHAGASRHQPQAVRPKSQTSPASLNNHCALTPLKLSKPSLNPFLFASLPSLGWISSRCLQLPG